jgi:hypothetical protein
MRTTKLSHRRQLHLDKPVLALPLGQPNNGPVNIQTIIYMTKTLDHSQLERIKIYTYYNVLRIRYMVYDQTSESVVATFKWLVDANKFASTTGYQLYDQETNKQMTPVDANTDSPPWEGD